MTSVLSIALLLSLTLTLALCHDDAGRPEDPPPSSAEEFFRRIEAALTRDGQVFYAAFEYVLSGPDGHQPGFNGELWLDGTAGQGRLQWRKAPGFRADVPDEFLEIVASGSSYRRSGNERPYRVPATGDCPQFSEPAFGVLIPFLCSTLVGDSPAEIDANATYEGTPAVALRYRQTNVAADPSREGEGLFSFYVERSSFVPLAVVGEFSLRDRPERATIVLKYDAAFLPRSSLPEDFFDPASIGWREPNVAEPLDTPGFRVTIYWLGRTFSPGNGLPDLTLASAHLGDDEPNRALITGLGEVVRLGYRAEGQQGGVSLVIWRPEVWPIYRDSILGRLIWDSPCAQRKDIVLPNGHAEVFLAYEPGEIPLPTPRAVRPGEPLPTPVLRTPYPTPRAEDCSVGRAFDRFIAHVYLDNAVVAVNVPFGLCCADGRQFGVYDTLEGMEAVVRGLRLRQPGE